MIAARGARMPLPEPMLPEPMLREPMPLWLALLLGFVAAPALALGALALLHRAPDHLLRNR
jgi:hypothetical protein